MLLTVSDVDCLISGIESDVYVGSVGEKLNGHFVSAAGLRERAVGVITTKPKNNTTAIRWDRTKFFFVHVHQDSLLAVDLHIVLAAALASVLARFRYEEFFERHLYRLPSRDL